MKICIILICKIAQKLLKVIDRGSALPGKIALKLDKNILGKFKWPKNIICITGTAGKTTIAGMVTQIYINAGYKVGNNYKGSNLDSGVISMLIENSDIFGNIKSDVLVIEIDERYIKRIFKYISPAYLIINNISRDQMVRNGHCDIVWSEIKSAINPNIHLILNADDPLVTKFAIEHKGKISYYGIKKCEHSKETNIEPLDILYCPMCNKKLIFEYFNCGNMGNYYCENGDFTRPKVEFETEYIYNKAIKINNQQIGINNSALYNIYNLSAAYIMGITDQIDNKVISKTLNNISLKIKRFEKFKIKDKVVTLLLSKNDTPISYNQSLEYVKAQKDFKTIILGFDTISVRYKLKDISWLYSINFETLNNDKLTQIICMGNFAYDIATRLKYADIDNEKIKIQKNSDNIFETIKKTENDNIYLIVPFDLERKFKNSIKKIEKESLKI